MEPLSAYTRRQAYTLRELPNMRNPQFPRKAIRMFTLNWSGRRVRKYEIWLGHGIGQVQRNFLETEYEENLVRDFPGKIRESFQLFLLRRFYFVDPCWR